MQTESPVDKDACGPLDDVRQCAVHDQQQGYPNQGLQRVGSNLKVKDSLENIAVLGQGIPRGRAKGPRVEGEKGQQDKTQDNDGQGYQWVGRYKGIPQILLTLHLLTT